MANENALVPVDITAPVTYESAFGEVTLSKEVVLKYLKRGNADLTEQEIGLFISLCRYQKLNPFIGEAYPIKFGNEFQMVVGYDTYKRRAEENPEYRGREDGIVVLRNNEISKREGHCLYPGDTLIGGWCRVFRERNGHQETSYTEVSLSEYQKTKDGRPTSNWATKPATMIRKVAVSQALRDAFPKDYEYIHTEYEMPNGQDSPSPPGDPQKDQQYNVDGAEKITKEDRQKLFGRAQYLFGKEKGNEMILKLLKKHGYESTQQLDKRTYRLIYDEIEKQAEGVQPEPDYDEPQEEPPFEPEQDDFLND